MKLIKQSKLYYREGNSDKVYEIELYELSDTEYIVNFRYGRRGANLKAGTKTPETVSRGKAEDVFSRLEQEKLGKGYQAEVDIPVEVPSLESVNPGTVSGAILQRLQDALDGKNTFKTEWKTSRVIWKAGELQLTEAVPFIIKLATKGDLMQTYSALWVLNRLKVVEAEPLFRSFAFRKKEKAYIRHMACEGLLNILQGEELTAFAREIVAKLPFDILDSFEKKDYQALSSSMEEHTKDGSVDYFSNLYLLCKVYPEILPYLHEVLQTWKFEAPYFKHIRAIYKLAQVRDDYATLALLAYRMEKERPSFTRSSYYASNYTKVVPEHAFSRYTKFYFQKDAKNTLIRVGDKAGAREYLRLAVSILLQYTNTDYKPGGEKPLSYYGYRYGFDSLYTFTLINYPECYDSPLLTTILFGNDTGRKLQDDMTYTYGRRDVKSREYYYNPDKIEGKDKANTNSQASGQQEAKSSFFDTVKSIFGKNKPEKREDTPQEIIAVRDTEQAKAEQISTGRFELHPEHWDAMPQAYVQLLMQARMDVIHRFAYQNLKAHPDFEDICNHFATKGLLRLLNTGFEYPQKLALEVLLKRKNEFHKDMEFIAQVINSRSNDAVEWAWSVVWADEEYFMDNAGFVVTLLSSTNGKNDKTIHDLIKKTRFSEERQQVLFGKVVAELLALENTEENNAKAKKMIERIYLIAEDQLIKVDWSIVEQLIVSPLISNLFLASKILLKKSQRASLSEIPLSLVTLFLNSEIPEVRSNGMKLLDQYSTNFLTDNPDFVFRLISSPYKEVVEEALKKIRSAFTGYSSGDIAIKHLVYSLIRKEQFEGAHTLINDFVTNELRSFWNSGLLPKDITSLIHSNYRQSQLTGYEILKAYNRTGDFTLGQIISFGSHELLAVRSWCWDYFNKNVSRIRYERDKALNILDSKWDDTREFAFRFFRTEFSEADWDADTLIRIIDSIRPDVENFGKELITTHFKPEYATKYLSKLSEHPSVNVQEFVSNLLTQHASGKVEAIRQLEYYFRSVLTRVNKAWVAKNRVYAFIHRESLQNEEIASCIVPMLDDLSAQSTIQDKSTCIQILTEIKAKYPHLDMHLMIKK